MPRNVSESKLRGSGWLKGAGGAWYYNLPGDTTTHIHLGGSNRGGTVEVTFVSLKLRDRFHAHFYNEQYSKFFTRSSLDTLPEEVATCFRKGLNAIGFV